MLLWDHAISFRLHWNYQIIQLHTVDSDDVKSCNISVITGKHSDLAISYCLLWLYLIFWSHIGYCDFLKFSELKPFNVILSNHAFYYLPLWYYLILQFYTLYFDIVIYCYSLGSTVIWLDLAITKCLLW